MAQFSFDVVNNLNHAEINNVYDQVKREIGFRFDFKDTPADVEWLDANKGGIKVTGASEMQIDAILDIIRKKLSTRNLSQKLLDTSKTPVTTNMKVSQEIPFKRGIDQDILKKLSKILREKLPKLKIQIQGEGLRISGPSKNDLQLAMGILRAEPVEVPLQFINFK